MCDEPLALRFFDSDDEFCIVSRPHLPHWIQNGTICFITWRTADSLPAGALAQWFEERGLWLAHRNIDPEQKDWLRQVAQLPMQDQRSFHRFGDRLHEMLDEGHGACVLRDPRLSGIVSESLLHFDGERYLMTDFVVMPNHVHLLAAFPSEDAMLAQCESWKHFTAVQINRAIGQSGRFWQPDSFDHLVRSLDQFEYLRQRYIPGNPKRAGLKPGEFALYSRPL